MNYLIYLSVFHHLLGGCEGSFKFRNLALEGMWNKITGK